MAVKNKNKYKTSDLSLSTTLSLYFPIESIEHIGNKKVVFAFIKSKELENLIGSYWQGEIKVDPAKFFNQLKQIKSLIYSQQ